jgi:hypothetical protein
MCFDVEMNASRKSFKNVTRGFFFYQEHKRNLFFGNFSWMLIFKNN